MAENQEFLNIDEEQNDRLSKIIISAMKRKFLLYFNIFFIIICAFYLFAAVFLLDLSPIIKSILESYSEQATHRVLSEKAASINQLIEHQCDSFTHALSILALSHPVQKCFLPGGKDDSRIEISRIFSSKANYHQLDFYYIIDKEGRIILSTALGHEPGQTIKHDPLSLRVLSGQVVSHVGLATDNWLEETGFGFPFTQDGPNNLDFSEDESQVHMKKYKTVVIFQSGIPIYQDNRVVGGFIGGFFIHQNRRFFETIHRIVWNSKGNSQFLSLIIDNMRIISTYISDSGTLENTKLTDQNTYNRLFRSGKTLIRNELIAGKHYSSAYLPLATSENGIYALIEIAMSDDKATRSFHDCYNSLRLRMYLGLLITSLLTFICAKLLAVRFARYIFVPLRKMNIQISVLIKKIAEASQQIKNTSSEILEASEEQSAYSSEQAASISETTATMEELATVTKQIANYAEQVVSVAQQTTDNAEKGYKSVEDTISSMKEIKKKNETSANEILSLGEKSQKIGQVMRFINSIASQTKLIAFNASIEASAAGDIGKRFGVVATEVRRLAENVVRSTDEIKKIITEIQKSTNRLVFVSEEETKKIDEGVLLSENSGLALQEILKIVTRTNQAARQISLITQQQRTASDQVVAALQEISVGATESVKSNKSINTAISTLDALSEELNNLINESALLSGGVAIKENGSLSVSSPD